MRCVFRKEKLEYIYLKSKIYFILFYLSFCIKYQYSLKKKYSIQVKAGKVYAKFRKLSFSFKIEKWEKMANRK